MKLYLYNWVQIESFFIMLYCTLNKACVLIAKGRTEEGLGAYSPRTQLQNLLGYFFAISKV